MDHQIGLHVHRARFAVYAPEAEEWHRIMAAIREGWHVMLVWDADTNRWRCDFLRLRTICSGEGRTIGEAAEAAWAETWEALRRAGQEARYRARAEAYGPARKRG